MRHEASPSPPSAAAPPPNGSAGPVTLLLESIRSGRDGAVQELFTLVYSELVRMAQVRVGREGPGETINATALVHEAFLRLVPGLDHPDRFRDHAYFFKAASTAMRRILVDRAKARLARKRGGLCERVSLRDAGEAPVADSIDPAEFLALDDALTRLEGLDPRAASVVKLRWLAGLSLADTAAVLGVSERLVSGEWAFAQRWLRNEAGLSA